MLSRGLLTGRKPTGAGDDRAHLPRFAGANVAGTRYAAPQMAQLDSEH